VPAGVVIAFATMGVFAIAQLDSSIDSDHARTVAVLVAGSVALMNLYRVARPLNTLRLTLVIVMSVLFAAAFVMPWSQDLFELPRTAAWAYGVAAAAIVASYPLLVLGSRISSRWRSQPAPAQ
jgi:peptidoglycan/LPS O-acetylase OafA/YrhL